MIKEKAGTVFRATERNTMVPGCTISRDVYQGDGYFIYDFALAEGTSISAESYAYPKLILVHRGSAKILLPHLQKEIEVSAGQQIVTPTETPVGIAAQEDLIYTEISLRKDTNMNKVIEAGRVFTLGDLVPYQDGRIVNMDVIDDEHMKFVVMSFDEGTGLPEHAAPGEALLTGLDGEGTIVYEGKEHVLHKGENFKFDKGGAHAVRADRGRFKMALLLTLE
jgi:quercetin dioxygenase-like cupin family protein